jgi:hypothetical protein
MLIELCVLERKLEKREINFVTKIMSQTNKIANATLT